MDEPVGLVTEIGPVVAVEGTVTVIWVGESIVKLVVALVLKMTLVTRLRLKPVMVTELPTVPMTGLMEVITGPLL